MSPVDQSRELIVQRSVQYVFALTVEFNASALQHLAEQADQDHPGAYLAFTSAQILPSKLSQLLRMTRRRAAHRTTECFLTGSASPPSFQWAVKTWNTGKGAEHHSSLPAAKTFNLVQTHLTPYAVIIRNDDRTPSEFSCSVPDSKECQESIFTFKSCQKECRYDPCHFKKTAHPPVA